MYAESYHDCVPRETREDRIEAARETMSTRIAGDAELKLDTVAQAIRNGVPDIDGLALADAPAALAAILVVLDESFRALHGLDTGVRASEAMTRLRELADDAGKFVGRAIEAAAAIDLRKAA